MIRRSAVLVVLVSLFAVVNTLHGMGVADSQGGEKFKCNTRFNNVIDAPSGFDCDWDESDARHS